MEQSDKLLEKKYQSKRTLEELIEFVAENFGVKPELICSGSRQKQCSEAKSALAWLAVEEVTNNTKEFERVPGLILEDWS